MVRKSLPDNGNLEAKITRTSFIFYESFFDSIALLDKKVQADVVLAIVRYGLKGETDPDLKPVASALFQSFKPQIDANNKKYLNGCKGAEHGSKGGRPPVKETPKKPQENPKKTPNDNVNVNESSIEDLRENEVYDQFKFLERWKAARLHYDKLPTNIEKLSTMELQDFKNLARDYTAAQFDQAISGLFFQNTVPAVRVRPKWFLQRENFETMLDCWLNKNKLFDNGNDRKTKTPKFQKGDV